MTSALIADDEPLMLQRLREALTAVWPALEIVCEARNGDDALAACRRLQPDVAFLDIRMPGLSGIEVAARLGDAVHVVFVTAYDEYAVSAFENGAVDYILKPVETDRLTATVERLKKHLTAPPADLTAALQALLNRAAPSPRLTWIRASLGNATRLIHVDDVLFFQSDTKYTRIVLKDSEALVRTPLKELLDGLDGERFWQVHRGTIVNAAAIDRAVREGPEKLVIHLREHREKIAVSRQYFHLFKQT